MKEQSGFSVVEGLLLLVAAGIIVGTGYYVWHSTSQTNKILDAAANQKTASSAEKSSTTDKASTSSQDYLPIKEWSVKLSFPHASKLQGYAPSPEINHPIMLPASMTSYPHNDSVGNKSLEVEELELVFEIGPGCTVVAYLDRSSTSPATLNPKSSPQYYNSKYYFFQNPGDACESPHSFYGNPPVPLDNKDVKISEEITQTFKHSSFKVEPL